LTVQSRKVFNNVFPDYDDTSASDSMLE